MAMPRLWRRLLLVALSLAPTALAVTLTNDAFTIAVGQPFTITWINASGPVTIDLLGGPDASVPMPVIETIATNVAGNTFTWTPSLVEQQAEYGLRVYDGITAEAYSFAFQIQGNVPPSSTATTLVSTTRPATSSATSRTTTPTTSSSPSETPSATSTPVPVVPSASVTPLSAGAKAGIGIGAAAAFIALMTWAFFRMRRAQREDAAAAALAKKGLELGKQPEKPGGGPGGPGGPGMKPGMGMGMGGGPPSQDGRGTPLMGGRDTPASSIGGRDTPGPYGQPGGLGYNMGGAGVALPMGPPMGGRPGHQSTYSVASTAATSRHYSMSSVVGQMPVRHTPEPWKTPK
ncbi:hypothetical protein QBC39DRAFT_181929 [Podospora conica]|nr:hypothetical protein QBC39DRAFT_181929 [Schizothecium conicum]